MKVDEQIAREIAKWIRYSWDGLGDMDISDKYPDWSRNGIGDLHMQGGKPALFKLARRIVSAIDAAGYEVRPKEPPNRVSIDLGNACERYPHCNCSGGLMNLVVCADRAMIEAAKEE